MLVEHPDDVVRHTPTRRRASHRNGATHQMAVQPTAGASMDLSDPYHLTLRALSDRIVEAQRPIRVLDAIKWDDEVERNFFDNGGRELPAVDREYYERRPPGFDFDSKSSELAEIESDVKRELGEFNPIGQIMRRMCTEYRLVVDMLENRGLPDFARRSRELYGSPSDVFYAGDPTLADLGEMMSASLDSLAGVDLGGTDRKNITGEQAVEMLQMMLDEAFPPNAAKPVNDDSDSEPPGAAAPERSVRVLLDDGIVSDAAAGSDYIKIRRDALFSVRDVRLLSIHEGFVHLGTTFNGKEQPICTFLSKGPPSSTVTQEGLAILTEIVAFASYPSRMRKLANRIHAVNMAENGADFLDVYRFYLDQGFDENDSYQNATRVFRGSVPTGGPFTKDISYTKGFVLIYNYIGLAFRKGVPDRVPLLFCGKTTLKDMRTLAQAVEEGVVRRPRFLPPQFADMNALAAWTCYANFLNHLNLSRIEADYAALL